MPSFFVLLILLGAAGSAFGERTLRPVLPVVPPDTGRIAAPETLAVEVARIGVVDGQVVLTWDEPRRRLTSSGPDFTGYLILTGDSPDELQPLEFTHSAAYAPPADDGRRFFLVKAVYAGRSAGRRMLRYVRRDARTLLDFEEGDLQLDSYDDQQDADPNDWEITDGESYPPSARSLKLSGNTWKRMAFGRQPLADTTVWQIAVMSVDGDTSAELQGFGIGDGARRMIYTFAGRETVWQHEWMIANQEARSRGRWQLYRLSVGYDWKIRYGYRPSVDELFFINDNDTTDPPATVYFDELTDVTGDIPPEPRPKARWRIDPTVEGPGTAVRFTATLDNRDPQEVGFLWDFGDGGRGWGLTPIHFFGVDGVFRVGLEARGQEGLVGRTSLAVEIGDVRLPGGVLCAFTGDVMLARRYEEPGGLIEQRGPEAVFERIRHRTTVADLFVVNLECPLTDEGTRHPTKDIVFRGRPQNVAGLTYAGVDVATLANNHVSDYGRRGLEETAQVLNAAGIVHSGAGMNEYAALQPVFRTVNGLRVGFLGFCNRTGRDYNARPYLDAGFDKDGYAYFSADNILRAVPPAAEQCDFLVIAVHGGQEYDLAPEFFPGNNDYPAWSEERLTYSARVDSATRELEHMAIDLGARLVISHHPHVLQGIELYEGVPIAHSLGNFAFDQNFWETWPSAMVWAEIGREGLRSVEIEPVFVDSYQPTPAVGMLGAAILDRLAGYSTPLNATVFPDYQRMRAVVALDPQTLGRTFSERSTDAAMRWIEADRVWRSEPISLVGGGFPCEIAALLPEAQDAGWDLRLGREVLLVGGMESEGAAVWNYNSGNEGRDSAIVHSGRYSSWLRRNAGQQDVVTDLIQRIPVVRGDRFTLMGWMRLTNGREAAIAVRYYRYRYDNQAQNILGDEPIEGRQQGTFEWRRLWQELTVPNGGDFLNVRWQLFGAAQGPGWLWADDVKLIRWDPWQPFEGSLPMDYPNDIYYLQLQTRRPVEAATVRYRTATLGRE